MSLYVYLKTARLMAMLIVWMSISRWLGSYNVSLWHCELSQIQHKSWKPTWLYRFVAVIPTFPKHCNLWFCLRISDSYQPTGTTGTALQSIWRKRVAAATPENIESGKRGELKINLPWLQLKKDPPDLNGHPATGSAEHYALYDISFISITREMKRMLWE